MDKKQTAIDWLEKEFVKLEATVGVHSVMYELIEQAKEMEKEQIEKAYFDCLSDCYWYRDTTELKDESEIYYNQTYGQK